jgi:hypothetical protein
MKICARCRNPKTVNEFGIDRSRKEGRNPYCAECLRALSREKYLRLHPTRPSPKVVDGKKRCNRCASLLTLEKFAPQTSGAGGRRSICRACDLPSVRSRYSPVKNRGYILKRKYGLHQDDYDRMLEAQNGRCAICGTDRPGGRGYAFHVDHCHDSGDVRGLLCHGCNVSLGHFKHSEAVLRSAIQYLAEGGSVRTDAFNTSKEALVGN